MKRGAPEHPKTYDLAECLNIRRPTAIGYLELLFHFTAQYAPQGDIGRYSVKRIEAGLDWRGKAGALVDALIQSGWIDRVTTESLGSDWVGAGQSLGSHTLVTHDWHDHADQAVAKRLERLKLKFLTLTAKVDIPCPPSRARSALPEPEPVPQPVPPLRAAPTQRPDPDVGADAPHVGDETSLPFALSEPALKPPGRNGHSEGKAERIRWFEGEFWPVVWIKTGKDAARSQWLLKAKTRVDADRLIAAAKAQGPGILAAAAERAARTGCSPSPLHPRTWLSQGRDADEIPLAIAMKVPPIRAPVQSFSERNEQLRREKFVLRMERDGKIYAR